MSSDPVSTERDSTNNVSQERADKLCPGFFESYLHQSFMVNLQSAELNPATRARLLASEMAERWQSGEPIEIELVEVTRYPKLEAIEGGFEHRPREPFSLLFRGSHEELLVSATYQVTHKDAGELVLFLNPVQTSVKYSVEAHPEGRFYESTIN